MRPSSKTLRTLVRLVSEMVVSEKTLLLYLYYCTCGSDTPTRIDVQKGTGLGLHTVRTHDRVLETLGAIERNCSGNGHLVKLETFDLPYPTPRVLEDVSSILNIQSQKDVQNIYTSKILGLEDSNIKNRSKGGLGRVGRALTVSDIVNDADYIAARVHLDNYFKDYEIDPRQLPKKNKFSVLVELLHDNNFDFGRYCKWYAENKYNGSGFGFGLFLYPKVIAEYQYKMQNQDSYKKPKDSLGDSDAFKSGVEKTKRFLKSLKDE